MKRLLKYAIIFYVAVLGISTVFWFLASQFPAVGRIALKLDKPVIALVLDDEIHLSPKVILGAPFDPKGRFHTLSHYDPSEVDYWVLIVNAFSEIDEMDVARQLGLAGNGYADVEPGGVSLISKKSISLRWHPLPVHAPSSAILLIEVETVMEKYPPECIGETFFAFLARSQRPTQREACLSD